MDYRYYVEGYKNGYTIWDRERDVNIGYVMNLKQAERECAALNAGTLTWEELK